MSCSGLWAFGRPFSLPGLMMIRQISLGPAPNIKARLLIGQIGGFPQNAFLLCDLKSKQPSVYWAVNPLCYTIVYRVCIRSIYSILYTVCVVYICDYHVDFSCHVALSLLCRRDWRLSCWYSIVLICSTLLRSLGCVIIVYIMFYSVKACVTSQDVNVVNVI